MSGRSPLFFEVPPDTELATCNGCNAPVYWILTKKKKKMPVDCHAGEGCVPPTTERPGRGLSHFATCPKADRFRQPRPPAGDERAAL